MIAAATNRRLPEEYKPGGEPEAFQLDKPGTKIYVNVPDLKQIVVVDRTTKQIFVQIQRTRGHSRLSDLNEVAVPDRACSTPLHGLWAR